MSTKRINRFLLFFLTLIPVIVLISAAVYASLNTLHVFPSKKYDAIGWWPFANKESIINSLETMRGKIVLEFTLGGSPAYAGLGIVLDNSYPFLDLSKYSELSVRLKAAHAKHFGVIIQTFEKDITQFKDGGYEPLRYCQIRNEINRNSDTYKIKLADLIVPEWWILFYGEKGKALDSNPLKESSRMQLFFDDNELAGEEDRIEVEEIAFHVFTDFLWIMLSIGAMCYYIVLAGIVIVFPRMRKTKTDSAEIFHVYKRIEKLSDKQRDKEIVMSYIKEHYCSQDISLEAVSRDTGISKKRIRDAVFDEYTMTFKECINQLRLKEAKRLLAETDMSIIDIAFSLGFSSNSYFASYFKNREACSPKEYREKNRHVM